MFIGTLVLIVAVLFWRIKFPAVKEESQEAENGSGGSLKDLLKYPHFILAVVAQFLYVAAQTGINSFFINYVTEEIPSLTNQQASLILGIGGMGLFWLGRFTGSTIFMRIVRPNRLLAVYAIANVITMALVVAGLGWTSVVALFSTYFFMSVMFPTIFALGIKDLGPLTKESLFISGNGNCRRSTDTCYHGLYCRHVNNGAWIYCTAGMLCFHCVLWYQWIQSQTGGFIRYFSQRSILHQVRLYRRIPVSGTLQSWQVHRADRV